MSLIQILRQMFYDGRPQRLKGGLALRYTPPGVKSFPPVHILSLSRPGVYPSETELRIVWEALVNIRPMAASALFSNATTNDGQRIRRINWREDKPIIGVMPMNFNHDPEDAYQPEKINCPTCGALIPNDGNCWYCENNPIEGESHGT